MDEVWKPIVGWEGWYEVSSMGSVRRTKPGQRTRPGRPVKASMTGGYMRVYLWRGNDRTAHRVHRLVAQAFLDNPQGLPQVDHIDGDKTNNQVSNLEWVTEQENIVRARKLGLIKSHKLSDEQVREIRARAERGQSRASLAEAYDVHINTIQRVVSGKGFKHVR